MNSFNAVGRLVKKPELKFTQSGKKVSTFSLAIREDKDKTTFINFTAFGRTAEILVEYADKGTMLGVSSKILNSNWEDKNGTKHYDYLFMVESIELLSSKGTTKDKQDTTGGVVKINQKDLDPDPFKEFGEQIEIEEGNYPFD